MTELTRKGIINENRAALLLGLPIDQLREISVMSGFGRLDPEEVTGQLTFTYEELHQLCRLVVGPGA